MVAAIPEVSLCAEEEVALGLVRCDLAVFDSLAVVFFLSSVPLEVGLCGGEVVDFKVVNVDLVAVESLPVVVEFCFNKVTTVSVVRVAVSKLLGIFV